MDRHGGAEELMSPSTAATHSEERRLEANAAAWRSFSGYRTTSGCPCWDRSPHVCVPKRLGYGLNPNFYVCFWWLPFGCPDSSAAAAESGAAGVRADDLRGSSER